jgi:hypothetical protein
MKLKQQLLPDSSNIFLLLLKFKIWVVEVVEPPKMALPVVVRAMGIVPVAVATE